MYLFKGNHDEITLLHQGMRDFQVRFIDGKVIVKQDINVDRAVFEYWSLMPLRGMRLFLAQVTLDLLSHLQEPTGGKGSLAKDDGIQESVFRLKAPRLCLHERRLT